MSTTHDTASNGELMPIESPQRMSAGTLDELYIECYLDNPSNKVRALVKAADLAGVDCDTSRQRAHQIHRRLQHKIDSGLIKNIMEGATLGYSVLYKMAADENTGESNRLKAAALLIEYAGKNKPDNTAKPQRKRESILEDIEQTKERIRLLTGENV